MAKICFIASSLFTMGGEQRVTAVIANELVKNNQIIAYTMDEEPDKQNNPYQVDPRIEIRKIRQPEFPLAGRIVRRMIREVNERTRVLYKREFCYNLLEYATKFAREGTTLYLGVTTIDGKARVTVRNVGDTIPAEELPLLYDGALMLNGGHIAGWAVEDPALIAQIEDALAVLGSQEEFDKKYPDATRRDPLTLAVGDGNHSLATAKACWEELKKTLTPEQAANHPARWCLAEVCNVHSPAIEIEPIHRVLFNVDCAAVLLSLITWSDSNMAGCSFGGSKQQPFTLAGPHMSNVLSFEDPTAPLTVGTIDEFIEYYLEHHKEARVDYVHDEPAVRALCKKGAVAFLMPPFAKSDLFKGVVMGGVLPRKTFSMGHAEEKRYYVECRKITE